MKLITALLCTTISTFAIANENIKPNITSQLLAKQVNVFVIPPTAQPTIPKVSGAVVLENGDVDMGITEPIIDDVQVVVPEISTDLETDDTTTK